MRYLSKMSLSSWIFLSLPVLTFITLITNSGAISSFLGAGVGSFTLNSSSILVLCIGLGAFWHGSQRNLAYCLLGANLAYRLYVYAVILPKQYASMGEHFSVGFISLFVVLLGSSYVALIIGFATLKAAAFLRTEFGKPTNGEG